MELFCSAFSFVCWAITPKAEVAGRTYTVKHGDTLWQIAQTYLGKGSRYTEIVKLSGLKSNVLYTGQELQIPEK
ncbi:MAG: LysM peptidoglycan-binding domain-containing protein [Clostridia bacterium]|nr:LysM peptidoglycan-binding domain-containing protein [Clostridia bacterium]